MLEHNEIQDYQALYRLLPQATLPIGFHLSLRATKQMRDPSMGFLHGSNLCFLSFCFPKAKYNQLMRIEEELGSACAYAGETWRKPTWMA